MYVQQLVLDDNDEVVSKTVALIPDVDQSFGGTFSPRRPARPRQPAVRGARPAMERQRDPGRRRRPAGVTAELIPKGVR